MNASVTTSALGEGRQVTSAQLLERSMNDSLTHIDMASASLRGRRVSNSAEAMMPVASVSFSELLVKASLPSTENKTLFYYYYLLKKNIL